MACCVFHRGNWCSACHSLVKIICFCMKTSFFKSFSVPNGKKERNKKGKHTIFPRSRPAFGCEPAFKSNTWTLVNPLLWHVFWYYLRVFYIYDRKRQKKHILASKKWNTQQLWSDKSRLFIMPKTFFMLVDLHTRFCRKELIINWLTWMTQNNYSIQPLSSCLGK